MKDRPLILAAVAATAWALATPCVGRAAEPRPTTVEVTPVRGIYGHLTEGPFLEPSGLYYETSEPALFVCDLVGHRIAVINDRGVPIFSFGSGRLFESPRRVLALPDGRVLVADATKDGVSMFDYDGRPLDDLDLSGAPPADRPISAIGLAVWSDGALAILDGANRRILVVEAGGTATRAIVPPPLRSDLLIAPQDLDVAPDGSLIVSDARGLAVQVYGRDGEFLRGWGVHDVGPDQFSLPAGIAVDGAGRVFVADTLRQDVKVFTPMGEFLTNFGGFGRGLGGLRYPIDVASDRKERVFVSERLGRRVQVFAVREVPSR